MRVMIVEDNPKMSETMKKIILRQLQNIDTVYECKTEQEAVENYEAYRPEWVLMDIQLEPGSGLNASRKIMKADPEAHIIIVTNYDEQLYRDEARNIGVRAYVMKENLWEIPGIMKNVF